ncbi:DUF1214 domain-containing protein [Archangium lansingense]|uniref:DUF1214 domain-containing protein n=1 Tax=Archangium lansingense TaxID=2995310 RepID=UPI003B7B78AE
MADKRSPNTFRELHARLHRGAYRAKPSRRKYIPKADGRQRPLGIASLEDKLVQRAVVEVMNAIYEGDFLGFSYGFRPGQGQHDALDALAVGITRKKVNWVLDADLRGFFDTIDHGLLMKFVEHRVGDNRLLRLMRHWTLSRGDEIESQDSTSPSACGKFLSMPIHVNVDNFARAETDRMFVDLQNDAGDVNTFLHNREPAPVDESNVQTVIRLNRDTLYSFAVVDISAGATLTLPDAGDRYISAMIVNEDHYVNEIFHNAGSYELTIDRFETEYVVVAVRILVNPSIPGDLEQVAQLQNQLRIEAGSARRFASPEYDPASLDETRDALLVLARGLSGFDKMFGKKTDVDQVRHLIGTAAGWGGLPSEEAFYVGVDPRLPVGYYELTVSDVPVDAFWSISVYNAAGYFEYNDAGVYSVNSVTGIRNSDGSITVRFGGDRPLPNTIPTPEGWNYLVRLYRPHPEIIAGTWSFPTINPKTGR